MKASLLRNVVFSFSVLLIGVCTAEEPKKSKTEIESSEAEQAEKLLADLSDTEKQYVLARLKRGGKVPLLSVNEKTDLHKGDIGYIVRNSSQTDFGVSQVVGPKSMLIFGSNLWIEGLDTSDIVDEQTINLKGVVFLVSGTKTYQTGAGSRTVKLLTAVDTSNADKVTTAISKLKTYCKKLRDEELKRIRDEKKKSLK